MKYNETISKWCKNKHGASKIIDMFETYHSPSHRRTCSTSGLDSDDSRRSIWVPSSSDCIRRASLAHMPSGSPDRSLATYHLSLSSSGGSSEARHGRSTEGPQNFCRSPSPQCSALTRHSQIASTTGSLEP
jgi:hypothetical protein